MQNMTYIARFKSWVRGSGQTRILVAFFLALGMAGTVVEGIRQAACICGESFRPKAGWKDAVDCGLAVSLNALERQGATGGRLPPMNIRGVVFDWQNRDWIIWGDNASAREGLPFDALCLAVRAATTELEFPGVDIRPADKSQTGDLPSQKVTYFGGVESTVVGQWFFRFDYWMKSAALGHAPIPVVGISPYWERVAHDANVQAWSSSEKSRLLNRCRFWLKNGEFVGIEDESVMVFKDTPLQVCAERLDNVSLASGNGDTVEDGFARDLTANLRQMEIAAPVREIEEFAKLLAGVAWLAKVDPYRKLSYWQATPVQPVVTEERVTTLRKEARLPLLADADSGSRRLFALELSGGVTITPAMVLRKAADHTLRNLGEAILRARPTREAVSWSFSFYPTKVNSTKPRK